MAMNVFLSGTGFGTGATVTFGGSLATSVVVVTSNYITCTTPTHAAGAVDVVVTNADGVAATLVSGYTYVTSPWWHPDWPTVIIPSIPIPPSHPGLPPTPPVEPDPGEPDPDPCLLAFDTSYPSAGTVGDVYTPVVMSTAGGEDPVSIEMVLGDLPPGLQLWAGETAALTGTPSEEGVFTFILRATDANSCTAYMAYTIIIWPEDGPPDDVPLPWGRKKTTQPTVITPSFPITPGGGAPSLPGGSIFTWTVTTAPTTDRGWWLSMDENFSGAGNVLSGSVPRDPRGFVETTTFSSSSASNLGGFPGPAGVWRNHLIYAKGGYTVGTTSPTIRIFDGTFDREVVTIPLAASSTVSKAVMSILVANDTVYVSTFDSGTSSADWSGRVFTLDPDRGTLTPLGDPFPVGHMPYALAWHLGRLWVGTNRQVASSSGKVYFFRPDIDTAWTQDYDLSSASQGGVTSLLSYKGLLYVGCSAPAATFAKVLVRSGAGVYTTSDTGTGGTATANNAFLALAEFEGKLYASYFNNDATKISKIRSFDNSSWSTAYTGASGTLVPFLGFPVDLAAGILLAIGGGVGYNVALVSTPDGSSWTDRTAFLDQDATPSTGLPVFGIVRI